MERVLLISSEPEKWKDLEESLSGSYEFVALELGEVANFSDATIIAIDKIENMEKIPVSQKSRMPLVFLGNSGDFSTEIQVRKLGASEFFCPPFDKELLLCRFKNLSGIYKLIKVNNDNLRWIHMIKREMGSIQEGMAEIIAQTVESRDENTGGHIIRTARFMDSLGQDIVNKGTLTE
jgi:putative two-component system response regulator